MVIVMIIATAIGITWIINEIKKTKLVKIFKENSVLVGGARGSGKDMLFNYIITRRRKSYISNVQYAEYKLAKREEEKKIKPKDKKWIRFDPLYQWGMGGNDNKSFIEGKINKYEYPYKDKIDYYISDIGVYFPAQEVTMLNKRYKTATVFQALLRHMGDANLHANTQAFNRPWDKIREQFEIYILCRKCKVWFGKIVRQKVTIYDRYESAIDKVSPMRKGLGRKARQEYEKFRAQYGEIKTMKIWYIMKKKYNTRMFKEMLKGGE